MKKHDIIRHLESLLEFQKNTPNQIEANEKRRKDLSFLNNYNIEIQREIFGEIIDKAKKYNKILKS